MTTTPPPPTSSSSISTAALPQIATGFVRKLYRILDQESGAVITWTRGGTAFAIFDTERLNELILPRYFRGRLCAFRQQLREHGFRELLATGGSAPIAPVPPPATHPPQPHTYFHEHFVRGAPGCLSQIARTPLPRRRVSHRKSKAKAAAAAAVASGSSHKRARITSTSATASSSSTASTSLSTVASDPPIHSSPLLKLEPPPASHQQAPLPVQPPPMKSQNPLFSTESDAGWGSDWLSLDDISPAGASLSSVGISSDCALSEDMLGALLTLVSSSMSTTTTSPSTTRFSSTPASCGATLSAAPAVPSLKCASQRSGAVVSAGGATLYETHQFSDETLNSMLVWLGSGSST